VRLGRRDERAVTRAFRELAGSNAIVAHVSDADESGAPSRTTVSHLGRLEVDFNNAAVDDGWHCCTQLEVEDCQAKGRCRQW
jgi:hypothetical protein